MLFRSLLLVIGIIIILSVLIITFIMHGITVPLRSLVTFSDKWSNGEYQERNDYHSTNELGVLSASMNRLAESVNFELTVKNGALEIADAMLANDDINVFCATVLEAMMSKTKSNMGAIYFLDETTSAFYPYYSCGYIKEHLKSFSAGAREGEFGHLLTGKRVVRITQIPADTIFAFSSVAGDILPKEIIAIPVMRQNNVIAVVSLASLVSYSTESLEIIRLDRKSTRLNSSH